MTFRRTFTSSHRKGFTLVELLIVIILIGILASAILLVAGGAEDKATANRILSDARTMKAAAMLYNSDHDSWPIWALAGPPPGTYKNMVAGLEGEVPSKYIGQLPVNDRYWLGVMNNESLIASGDVIAAVILYDQGLSSGVKCRMELMAREMGIYAMDNPRDQDFSQVHAYSQSDTNMMWFLTSGP